MRYVIRNWYCICGGNWGCRNATPRFARALEAEWNRAHAGPGHAPATARQAAAARLKAERAAARNARG